MNLIFNDYPNHFVAYLFINLNFLKIILFLFNIKYLIIMDYGYLAMVLYCLVLLNYGNFSLTIKFIN